MREIVIGFLLYFATAVGIVFPVALSVIDGKTPWSGIFTAPFLGPPGLLGFAAFMAVFTPRFAGCFAFAGCVSCWIYSGPNVFRSIATLVSAQNFAALGAMDMNALLKYGLGWLPTLGLILATFYSLYRALKLPRDRRDDEITVGAPSPPP
jgi:hypothetical protein